MAPKSGTELFYGTLDTFGLVMNLLSLLVLSKFTRLFHSELFILICSLALLSLSGCALFLAKILQNLDTPGNLPSLASLALPILYNLFLPAILSKGYNQLVPAQDYHFSCSYLYGSLCCSLVVFFVMVISPMPGMDYHKFKQPVHASHTSLHTSVATPLLMISGAVPQLISAILSLIQIQHIGGSLLCCRRYTKIKHATYEQEMVKKYLRRWGLCSVALVMPSACINTAGFGLWKLGMKLPAFIGFCHAFLDSSLFLTQPLALTVLWSTCKLREMNSKLNHRLFQQDLAKQLAETGHQGLIFTEIVPQPLNAGAAGNQPLLQHYSISQPLLIASETPNELFLSNGLTPEKSLELVQRANSMSRMHLDVPTTPAKSILEFQPNRSFSTTPSPVASLSIVQSEV